MSGMRDRLRDRIMSNLDEVYINGSMEHRLPQNLNISFAYVEGESLLMGINDVAVSSGSACTSATLEPSYVLKALGTGDDLAHSSIRFGLGRFNTEAEVDYVADRVVETVQRLRELSPQADAATRTYAGRFTITDADDTVALGMTATVTLVGATDAKIARLPLAAVLNRGSGPSVYVVDASGALELRDVKVAAFTEDAALVTAGVRDGESVVTLGVQKLQAGFKVRTVDAR